MTQPHARHVVGYFAGKDAGAAFARAALVLDQGDGHLLVAGRWVGGKPEGRSLSPGDFAALVAGNEATACALDFRPGGTPFAWILGRQFEPLRAEFIDDIGAALLARMDSAEGGVVLIVDEVGAPWVRSDWGAKAMQRATEALEARKPADALGWATIAWLVSPTTTPEHVALLVRTHDLNDLKERAAGLRTLHRNSRGQQFDRRVEAALHASLPSQPSRPWREASGIEMEQQLRSKVAA